MNVNNKKICFVSVDVEDDFSKPSRNLNQRTWEGVKNLDKVLGIFERHNVSANLFITGQTMERFPELVMKWSKDYEIACHSFTHSFWNNLNFKQRQKELRDFAKLYKEILKKSVRGFRAPSHIIDEEGIKLLQDMGFLYDSSIVPHYLFFNKYRGYKKRAPLSPYYPSRANCRKKGNMKILEIPVSGFILGIPLWGSWLKHIPLINYKNLLKVHSPEFLTLSMHSWDVVYFKGKIFKNSATKFQKILEKIILLLEKQNYSFLNGKQILENFKK